VLGITLIPWQRWLLIHAHELRPDGRFRFRTVLILVARQNGKTSIVEIKNLWKMFVVGVSLVISVAQELDVAEESWENAVEIVKGIPELAAEAELPPCLVNGRKALKLHNGSRWKPKAAGRRPGRGLSGDDVNLDELREHQNYLAWAAVTKTTMARPNPQVWAFSNAGDDKSVVLNDLRELAIGAIEAYANGEETDTSLGIMEWSAPDNIKCTCMEKGPGRPHDAKCLLRDEAAIAQANPSLGYTIDLEAVLSALATDPEAIYRTEVLCQRVKSLSEGFITSAEWQRLQDADSKRDGDIAIALDISTTRNWASIAVYGKRADGLGHVQLVDYRAGTDWIVERLVELRELDPVGIGMGRGSYESLKPQLNTAGFYSPDDLPEELREQRGDTDARRGDLLVTNATTMAAATGQFVDAARQQAFKVVPSEQADTSVAGAQVKTSGTTIAWSPKDSAAEISPVVAETVARYTHIIRLDAPRELAFLEPSAFHI
jgi:phage terminase large subunit-like protein